MRRSYSYSKISKFKQCRKAFQFSYVLREQERFSTIERHLGSTVHEALRLAYADGRARSIAEILEHYDLIWHSVDPAKFIVVKSGIGRDDYRQDGKRMVSDFLERVYQKDASETLAVERRFAFDLDGGIGFRGIIDRLDRQANGALRLTDYKTGKRETDARSDPQLACYAIHVLQQYPDDRVELAYENLRHQQASITEFRRDEIGARLQAIREDIALIEATDSFPAAPSILCKWCGYSPICEDAAVETVTARPPSSSAGAECPSCGKTLEERHGRFGTFIGCRGFPNCRYTRNSW